MKFDKLVQDITLRHEIDQAKHELKWLRNKMAEVKEEMKKRPSKVKHLNDLQRQVDQTLERIKSLEGRLSS
jgi:predicted  nucleic acid-binding Zn-ribbon protein